VCTILLQSLEALQSCAQHLLSLFPDLQRPPDFPLTDTRSRLKLLSETARRLDNEEDFLLRANSDISQLCAENILLWNRFLDTFTRCEIVRRHLAEIHHNHRIRRFAEGFFTMNNPRKSVLCCLDTKHQHYIGRKTRAIQIYFNYLTSLRVAV
jgi:hypothetical protein